MGKTSKRFSMISHLVMVVGIIMLFMTTGYKAKAYDSGVDQIAQTKNSVTVQLNPDLVKRIRSIRYGISEITVARDSFAAANAAHAQAISSKGVPCKLTGNTYTFTGLKAGTSYYIDFGYNDSFTDNCLITTLPDKPTNVKAYMVNDLSSELKLDYRSGVNEYKYEIYNTEGQLVDRGRANNLTSQGCVDFFPSYRDNPCVKKLVVTPIALINGRNYYGESATTYYIDQPDLITGYKSRSYKLQKGKLSLTWHKVDGATAYDIYISDNRTSGYEKAATVKGKSDSVTIRKCHKKKISKKKTYYVLIRPKYKKHSSQGVNAWEINKKHSKRVRID